MKRESFEFETTAFLRSINLRLDLSHPENVSHFYPTTKNAQIINTICGLDDERVSIASASYGFGKSLTATFSGLAIEGLPHSHPALRAVGERFSPPLAKTKEFIEQRLGPAGGRGLVIALEGYAPDLVAALARGAIDAFRRIGQQPRSKALKGAATVSAVLNAVARHAQQQGLDRIAIIWDEFGRHLEGLIGDARADELADIQTLAETVARQRAVPMTLTLILHQSFFNYTGHLNQSARNEWRKIEGRFRQIDYQDDSREMYELLGHVIATQRGISETASGETNETAEELLELGLFGAFTEPRDLGLVLAQSRAYDPAVIYLLPRLAARVAQNERTLFDFLHTTSTQSLITLSDLYAFFSPAMQADSSLGGTYRQWLEAESAISKAQSEDEETVLKATCLMTLGLSGSRFRVGVRTLAAAAAGQVPERRTAIDKAIEQLIERKLLLYRRHNDDVSVWHGTDADLRGRLEDETLRAGSSFDLYDFLAKEWPAPTWRPVEYNSRNHIRRAFVGMYVEAAELLEQGREHPAWTLDPGDDGRVVYALARSQAEIDASADIIAHMPDDPGIVLALPPQPLKVFDAALEVACLSRLQTDEDLVGADPLVLPELRQMIDDARVHLASLMDRIVKPRPNGPLWYSRRLSLRAETPGELRRALSRLMASRFKLTARVHSEALVRRRLSRPMVNARKKLVLGILERSGEPDLRFSGTTPDASMYRTVLCNTGLYRQREPGGWGWAEPQELADSGLRALWEMLAGFFTEPSDSPKSIADLVQTLASPPFGLRAGVVPVLFAAGLKAFPAALSILRDDAYLPDILPSDIELLFAEPERHSVYVFHFGPERLTYLHGFLNVFGQEADSRAPDLVRRCFDALEAWKRTLPAAAWATRQLGAPTAAFRELLRNTHNPADVLFERIPQIAETPESYSSTLLDRVAEWRDELINITAGYLSSAEESVRIAIDPDGLEALPTLVRRWTRTIPPDALDGQSHELRAVLRIFRQAGDGGFATPEFLDALATVVVERPLADWDDSTAALFARRLPPLLRAIEDAAISGGGPQVIGLVEERVSRFYAQLVELAGSDGARDFIEKLHETTEAERGNTARSTRA